MGRAVGIDLGTTFSAVAVVGADGQPEILPNREGERITPSVVHFQDETLIVGAAAREAAAEFPFEVVSFVKRHIGNRDWSFHSPGGQQFDAEVISAAILRKLTDDAQLALGEPIDRAVISVPAYFDDARRQATIDAAEVMGLEVLALINEPTAAALSFGVLNGVEGTVLVYDLGGGTFDVTIMTIKGLEYTVLATQGDRNLGGFDWDNALMNHIAAELSAASGVDLLQDEDAVADLRSKAERAKRTLSTTDEARITVRLAGRSHLVRISRSTFESLTSDLLERTRLNVEFALEDAGLMPDEVDHLLLIGGSTRMPMVTRLMTDLLGRSPAVGAHPDEAVALGAAIVAGQLSDQRGREPASLSDRSEPAAPGPTDIALHDVTASGLGVVTADRNGGPNFNTVLLPRNSPVPGHGVEHFETGAAGQRNIRVEITEGDESDLDYVTVVGTAEMDLPYRPDHTPLRIEIAYSASGVISARIFDGKSGAPLGAMDLERRANLSSEQKKQAGLLLSRKEIL